MDGGSIYDPKNGKTYDCYAWFEDGDFNNLYIKGYVAGIKALGRKTIWTKTEYSTQYAVLSVKCRLIKMR